MDVITLAIPFFVIALAIEWFANRRLQRPYFRLADTIASLSAGAFSTLTGLLTKGIEIAIYAGLIHMFSLPMLAATHFDTSAMGLLNWLGALLLWDFCYYWHHRLGHEVNVLWAAHVVHHQSEEYNLSTALRQTSTGFLLGWIFYLPMLVIGIPVFVIATVAALDLIYQFWVHTRFVGSLGWFDRVFVSPSNHRVHHAQNSQYLDRNYGGILVIWDRVFGTFQPERADNPCVFGVRKPLRSWNPVSANLQGYRDIVHKWQHCVTLREYLASVFARPAWQPAALGGPVTLSDSTLEPDNRYDSRLPRHWRGYVFLQFVTALVATASVGFVSRAWPAWGVAGAVVFIGGILLGIALAFDRHRYFLRFEQARIMVSGAVVAVWLVLSEGPGIAIVVITTMYFGCSVGALMRGRRRQLCVGSRI